MARRKRCGTSFRTAVISPPPPRSPRPRLPQQASRLSRSLATLGPLTQIASTWPPCAPHVDAAGACTTGQCAPRRMGARSILPLRPPRADFRPCNRRLPLTFPSIPVAHEKSVLRRLRLLQRCTRPVVAKLFHLCFERGSHAERVPLGQGFVGRRWWPASGAFCFFHVASLRQTKKTCKAAFNGRQ